MLVFFADIARILSIVCVANGSLFPVEECRFPYFNYTIQSPELERPHAPTIS